MDAVKFIEERDRMCRSFEGCEECPAFDIAANKNGFCALGRESTMDAADQIAIVHDWSVVHPRKTRQSEFLKQWPKAELDTNGAVAICPTILSSDYRSANKRCKYPGTACSDCRREFWMQEVE